VPPERFHRLFYPQVPAVVTASHGGEVGALLATSVMPASLNPPKVAAALGREHRTTRLVTASNMFGVCWVSYECLEKVVRLALPTEPSVRDKLAAAGLGYRFGHEAMVPVLDDAAAWLECRVEWVKEAGDHFLVLGAVVHAQATDDFAEYWGFRSYSPVLYVGEARREWPRFVRFPSD
jgi:flavin reductase (DIM6/NTAB) family NADH-FMN oxidoreductase RutF